LGNIKLADGYSSHGVLFGSIQQILAMLEAVYKKAISTFYSDKMLSRVTARLTMKLIRKIVVKHDPLIHYKLNGYDLKIPMSHALPLVIQEYPDYSGNLARVAKCVLQKYPDLAIIDIGANVGDSVFMLKREACCPILCIEGDAKFFEILSLNTAQCEHVTVRKVFIGDADKNISKELKIIAGTAHLAESNHKVTEVRTLAGVLSTEPQFAAAKMLKIDTDGFDSTIIRGAADFITAAKPVIFFEYDPYFLAKQNDDGISIFPWLSSFGYELIAIYDNLGRYILSLPLAESVMIEDMHRYLLGRGGKVYYDICAVHAEDVDIMTSLRQVEGAFSQSKLTESHH
jgi:FkbM family methyltransferase